MAKRRRRRRSKKQTTVKRDIRGATALARRKILFVGCLDGERFGKTPGQVSGRIELRLYDARWAVYRAVPGWKISLLVKDEGDLDTMRRVIERGIEAWGEGKWDQILERFSCPECGERI